MNRRWKTKTKCVDDNLTDVGSIVDRGGRFIRRPGCLYIYEGFGMRITDREGRQGIHYDDYIMYEDKNIHGW